MGVVSGQPDGKGPWPAEGVLGDHPPTPPPPPPAPAHPQLSPLRYPTPARTSTPREEVAGRGKGVSSLVVSGESLPTVVG